MNERYRYGYGDEPRERESTFSRQGSMTGQRADVDQGGRGDEEDEDRRADRIREADSETAADRAEAPAERAEMPADRAEAPGERVETPADRAEAPGERGETPADRAEAPGERGETPADRAEAPASTPSSSVFDVEEEAAGSTRAATGEPDRADTQPARGTTGAAGTAEPAADTEERPPIALGPPARTIDGETAGTAKPEAATPATGTPTDETPAAVSTGVEAPESDQAGQRPPGTATEVLVPGPGPAPVAAPHERGTLLGSIDADAIRARFLDIQAGFVDEPRQAVQEAERFVDEMVQDMVKALENERAKLKGAIEEGSTEDLRIALRGYRAFVDRLLNLSM
jgi:hypothetical protein